jgi:hypothetical protein
MKTQPETIADLSARCAGRGPVSERRSESDDGLAGTEYRNSVIPEGRNGWDGRNENDIVVRSRADHRLTRLAAPFGDVRPVGAPVSPVATLPRCGRHQRNVGERGATGGEFSAYPRSDPGRPLP